MKAYSRTKIINEGFNSKAPREIVDKVMTEYFTKNLINEIYNPGLLIKYFQHKTALQAMELYFDKLK